MPRLLGLLVALLVVLVGLGSAFVASGSNELLRNARMGGTPSDAPTAAAIEQQGTQVPDPDQGADRPTLPAESDDDDDDCSEESAMLSRFSVSVSFPISTYDPLVTCGIQPSQGHRAGPEKPPRA